MEGTDLFRAGEGGYFMYRIPGIVVTGRGTILAYCEARAGQGDWTPQDVLPVRLSVGTGGHAHRPSDLAVVYSDLAVGPEGTIYCFFERGAEKQNHFHPATLTLARFNLAWLTEPQPVETKIRIGAHHCPLREADKPADHAGTMGDHLPRLSG